MITNGYTTLAAAKGRLHIDDTLDDGVLEAIITSVSREIDDYCGRRFYTVAASGVPPVAETRYYRAVDTDCLLTDDILTLSSLATDHDGDGTYECVWASTDYQLEPSNAALDGQPYWRIRVAPLSNNYFPAGMPRGVKLMGTFGFSTTTPKPVEEACLAQVGLILHAPDVAAMPGGGVSPMSVGLHPFVKKLLGAYIRVAVG